MPEKDFKRKAGDAVKFAKVSQMHSKQRTKKNRDGSFFVYYPRNTRESRRAVDSFTERRGRAPPEIVEAVRKGAQAIVDRTS